MIIALTYPNSTAWVGFFIMTELFRGQGLGRELWKEMERTFQREGSAIIGLDGVAAQVETYKRRGFVDCARIPLMIRESVAKKPIDVTWSHEDAVAFQALQDIEPETLVKLDLEHTGLDRRAYWQALVSPTHALGYAIVSDGTVTGFVFARPCEQGHRIGPPYAATYAQARQLLHKIMEDFAGCEEPHGFVAEIFGSNSEGQKVFEELGWKHADVTYHRMWLHGKIPKEQQEGGKGAKGMYAVFDAGAG
jgi:GNAT superfamily N-acetyltransferase